MPTESLTIVLPAYNEEARLGSALDELFRWLRGPGRTALPQATHVLVVDDGSTDGTIALVRARPEFATGDLSLLPVPHGGKGRSGPCASRTIGKSLAARESPAHTRGEMRDPRPDVLGTGTDQARLGAPRRYRAIIGTREDLACAEWATFPTALCGQPATRIFNGGGSWPMCEAHWEAALHHLDAGSGCVARRDETGVWRPAGQHGDDRADPYEWDW